MRSLVLLTILILLCGIGYIGFSVLTFEPEVSKNYSLELSENVNENILDDDLDLSEQEELRRDQIVTVLKSGIEKYNREWSSFPDQVESMSAPLIAAIKSGILPVLYPLTSSMGSTMEYKALIPVSSDIAQVPENADVDAVSAAQCVNSLEGFVLGDTGRNELSCEEETRSFVRFYSAGPGDDIIKARGNSIINPGPGNDQIQSGPELTVIYLEPNFGVNNLVINCSSSVANLTGPKKNLIPWSYEFTHFIVIDPKISKEDIEISTNALKHKVTGDQILFNQKCFNVVFMSEG